MSCAALPSASSSSPSWPTGLENCRLPLRRLGRRARSSAAERSSFSNRGGGIPGDESYAALASEIDVELGLSENLAGRPR